MCDTLTYCWTFFPLEQKFGCALMYLHEYSKCATYAIKVEEKMYVKLCQTNKQNSSLKDT